MGSINGSGGYLFLGIAIILFGATSCGGDLDSDIAASVSETSLAPPNPHVGSESKARTISSRNSKNGLFDGTDLDAGTRETSEDGEVNASPSSNGSSKTTTESTVTTTGRTVTTTASTITTTGRTVTTSGRTVTTTGSTTGTRPSPTTGQVPTTAEVTQQTQATDPPSGSGSKSSLYGYLWGDGSYQGDDKFFFRTSSIKMANNFRASAKGHADSVTEGSNGSWITFTVKLEGQSGLLNSIPDGISDKEAFAAAVIEGEGDKVSGLVLDDGRAERRNRFAELLNELGVSTRISGVDVFAEESSWDVFESWPFVVCGRVPGPTSC